VLYSFDVENDMVIKSLAILKKNEQNQSFNFKMIEEV